MTKREPLTESGKREQISDDDLLRAKLKAKALEEDYANTGTSLDNPKWELLAQYLAQGIVGFKAYTLAGFSCSNGNFTRLTNNEIVKARVRELQGIGVRRALVTVERVTRELASIAFSDIRKVLQWRSNVTEIGEDPDTGEPQLRAFNEVAFIDSKDIDDHMAAAIAEVTQDNNGKLRVKLHSKDSALRTLAQYLGMIGDKKQTPDKLPVQVVFQLDPRQLKNVSTEELVVLEKVVGRMQSGETSAKKDDGDAAEYESTLH